MISRFITNLKEVFFYTRPNTLPQWQEKSFVFVLGTICMVALPALINSTMAAAKDGLWINLFSYTISYLACLIITFVKAIPFKIRAWTGILIFFMLGALSVFSVGPLGSGRIWLFTTTIFTTLILGLKPGAIVLLAQSIVLISFYLCLNTNFAQWANLNMYSPRIWVTTSITMMFLSIVSMVAVGRLIKGISTALEDSRQTSRQLKETTRQLAQRVDDHNKTIESLKKSELQHQDYEKRFRQAQKMEAIGTLAGGIAHDFNNVLAPIMGYTELMLNDLPKDSPMHANLNEVYSASLRAKDLVKQILTFSRQETSEYKLVRIQHIIKETVKLIRSTIPATIEIKQKITADCGLVQADPTQIHQIIMNLMTNAYHALEETGGRISISLEEIEYKKKDPNFPDMIPGKYACLNVTDTGTGIATDVIEKIFDPFFTTKSEGKGTGMGLSVVHGIIKSANGFLHVESLLDKGTEFEIYLPIAENGALKNQPIGETVLCRGSETILLVDDEQALISMEKKVLERLGYTITSRVSSIDALEAFRSNPQKFDLVITDLAMPRLPGDKLSIELKKIRPDIPILLCTGFSENMSEKKIGQMGIDGFLLKPIVMKELAQKIRDLIEAK